MITPFASAALAFPRCAAADALASARHNKTLAALQSATARPSSSSSSPSSHAWLQRQNSDPYVARAAADGWRSRAAFKLLELDDRFDLLRPTGGGGVVDLGAAPGSWTQVACARTAPTARGGSAGRARGRDAVPRAAMPPSLLPLRAAPPPRRRSHVLAAFDDDDAAADAAAQAAAAAATAASAAAATAVAASGAARVVAIDLLPMAPVPGAAIITGDFTTARVRRAAAAALGPGGAGLILSDMAHSFTGSASLDHVRQSALAWTAAVFAFQHLRPGGHLLVKVRYGEHLGPLVHALRARFFAVSEVKPPASRAGSAEAFLVARRFAGGAAASAAAAAAPELAALTHLGVEWTDGPPSP